MDLLLLAFRFMGQKFEHSPRIPCCLTLITSELRATWFLFEARNDRWQPPAACVILRPSVLLRLCTYRIGVIFWHPLKVAWGDAELRVRLVLLAGAARSDEPKILRHGNTRAGTALGAKGDDALHASPEARE